MRVAVAAIATICLAGPVSAYFAHQDPTYAQERELFATPGADLCAAEIKGCLSVKAPHCPQCLGIMKSSGPPPKVLTCDSIQTWFRDDVPGYRDPPQGPVQCSSPKFCCDETNLDPSFVDYTTCL
eukprot:TRINITY_DN2002_c0_g1_i2.p1 TRINITY_DN2002_c0_g1~~TRINITY_DN2002_c0_g1_i2.p1  ORF type:complete len:125 (-),score=16.02 TRINITY_DN2002_c0_g1_i2:379-753(-)